MAAPGVNVSGPSIGRRSQDSIPMTTRTGTSVAAAHVAGAVANLLIWGIIEGHNIASYPNREWGYGALDLHETFYRLH